MRFRLALLLVLGLTLPASVRAQGTIKFDFLGRYDTLLTSADTALLKLTLIEFHRKLARAGYAAYFWRDPDILARYADVEPDSIRAISDTQRTVILQEIRWEIEQCADTLLFSRIRLSAILFLADTLVQLDAYTPLDGESPEGPSRYTLHLHRPRSQWWVGGTGTADQEIRYRNYLDLPDEDIEEILER